MFSKRLKHGMQNSSITPGYWNIKELSEFSGFPVGTLYNWVNQRRIPYNKIGGSLRFNIDTMKRYFESRGVKVKAVA
jgi:excisionase family DNA binding protein